MNQKYRPSNIVGALLFAAPPPNTPKFQSTMYVGTTKLEIRLPAGSHHVVVRKRGFLDWDVEIQVIAGGRQSLWAQLAEAPGPAPPVATLTPVAVVPQSASGVQVRHVRCASECIEIAKARDAYVDCA